MNLNKIWSKIWPILFIISWLILLGILDEDPPILTWFAWCIVGLWLLVPILAIYVIFIKRRRQTIKEIRDSINVLIKYIKSLKKS